MKIQIASIWHWEFGEVIDEDFRKGVDSKRILGLWGGITGLSRRLLDIIDCLFLSTLQDAFDVIQEGQVEILDLVE